MAGAIPEIPRLNWPPRSDWINVKQQQPAAIGDGKADDSAALQSVLDAGSNGRSIYLPPGQYRLTRTLVFHGPGMGNLIVGHGRETRLFWDGPNGGVMFRSDGIAYSRYVGLSWDGRNRAAVGFEHASQKRFETEVTHQHEAFRNFTAYGLRIGAGQKVASAELLYQNCLFENCGTALGFLTFNDYDNTIDRCEFRHCGIGVFAHKSNFYARNSHFQSSRDTDFLIEAEHGCSIRRCTSFGSRRFVMERGTIAPLTIQDCQVSDWTDPEAAVVLNGSPVLVFDSSFTATHGEKVAPPDKASRKSGKDALPRVQTGPQVGPANSTNSLSPSHGERAGERSHRDAAPGIPIQCASAAQKVLLSGNEPAAVEQLVRGAARTNLYVIPSHTGRNGVVTNSRQTFLQSSVSEDGRIFDVVHDFGAKGDGKTDDTAAIQAAIDAARKHGRRAIAYLPTGRYVVRETLRVTGASYQLAGSGFNCGLVWRGEAGAPFLRVTNVQEVTLSSFMIGHHDLGAMTHGDDILVQSSAERPFKLTLDEVYAFGMYQKSPDRHGIHFDGLGSNCLVNARHVQGNIKITECAGARLLFRTSYEGTVSISGRDSGRAGVIGFLTRLSTQSEPALRIRDNQSAVFSDFYIEQSGRLIELAGKSGLPRGRVTMQCPKFHAFTNAPVITTQDYLGRVYLGQSQFYLQPKEVRFDLNGEAATDVVLAGNFWYQTKLELPTNASAAFTLVGNGGPPDSAVDNATFASLAAALDDLRTLGRLDLERPW